MNFQVQVQLQLQEKEKKKDEQLPLPALGLFSTSGFAFQHTPSKSNQLTVWQIDHFNQHCIYTLVLYRLYCLLLTNAYQTGQKDEIELFANLGIWVAEEKPYQAYAHREAAIQQVRRARYGGYHVEDHPMEHPDADVEGDQGVQALEGDVVGDGRVAGRLGGEKNR